MPLLTPVAVGTPGAAVTSPNNVATPTTLTPPTGSGYAVGDVLLCYTACRSGTPTVATPSGWTSLLNVAATNGRMALFVKVAASISEAAPSVVWSGLTIGTSGTPVSARVRAFSNVALDADVAGAVANGAASTATSVGGAAITSLQDNDLVLSLTTRLDDVFTTFTAPAGFTSVLADGSTSGLDFAIAWAYQVKTPPGAISAPSFGLTGASSFASSGVMVAIKALSVATDSASGTVTASGSGTEEYFISNTDSASGIIIASGSGTEAYVPAPPSRYDTIIDVDSPVSHWKLGNTTTATDRKGVLDLPAVNGPVATSSALVENAGPGANALTANQSFRVVSSTGLGTPYDTGTFSVEAWVRLSVLPPGDRESIQRGNQALVFRDDGWVLFSFKDGTNALRTVGAPGGALGTVQHVVITHDNSNLVFYLNGIERDRLATAGGAESAPDIPPRIGSVSDGFTVASEMDEIAWYSTALSAGRVIAHYNAGIRTAYDQVIDVDSPVSHWKLGDADIAYDRKGMRNLPAVNGPVAASATSLIANNNLDVGSELVKSAQQRFVAPQATGIGAPYNAGADPWSVEAWFKTNQGPGVDQTVFYRRKAFQSIVITSGQLRWSVETDTGGLGSSVLALVIGRTYHVVLTYTGTQVVVFLNGVEIDRTSVSAILSAPDQVHAIGAWEVDATRSFDGVIDEVAFYNTSLSAARVLAHYDAGSFGDRGSGTITASGSRTESWSASDSAAGVVTASGTKLESYVYTDSRSGTVTASGTVVENTVYTDAASGTIAVSGISIETHTTLTAVARISLASGMNPTTRTDHKLCFRARKTSGSVPVHLWAALYQGSTNRSGDLVSGDLTTSLALYVLPVPDASAASISSYSDLELRFWGESPQGSTTSVEVADAWVELPPPGSDLTPPTPIVTLQSATKISRVVGKDSIDVTFTTDEEYVEYMVRIVSSPDDVYLAGSLVEAAVVAARTSDTIQITDDELIAAAAIEGSNTLKIFVKDVAGNWST